MYVFPPKIQAIPPTSDQVALMQSPSYLGVQATHNNAASSFLSQVSSDYKTKCKEGMWYDAIAAQTHDRFPITMLQGRFFPSQQVHRLGIFVFVLLN